MAKIVGELGMLVLLNWLLKKKQKIKPFSDYWQGYLPQKESAGTQRKDQCPQNPPSLAGGLGGRCAFLNHNVGPIEHEGIFCSAREW